MTQTLKDGRAYVSDKPAPPLEPPVATPQRMVAPIPVARDTGPANPPIVTAVNSYLEYVKQKLSKNTYIGYRSSMYSLLNYLNRHGREKIKLGGFDSVDGLTWLDEVITVEGNANRTRNNRANDGTTFFNHYIARERPPKVLVNPFEGVEPLPAPQHKHQSYSKRQQGEYREAAEALGFPQLLLYCRFIYYTLARPGEEIRKLRVRDLRERVIYITADNAKTGEGAYVDIPAPLEKLIEQFRLRTYPGHYYVFSYNDEPGPDLLGPKYLYRRHIKVLERMQLTETNHDLYSWKHTGAVALWEATHDIELVRRQCRHTDIRQTIEYLQDLGIYATNENINKFPEF